MIEREAGPEIDASSQSRRTELVLADSLPGLARIAAGLWIRTAVWSVGGSIRISARLAHAALSPEYAGDLAREWGTGIRTYAREMLGVTDLDARMGELTAPLSAGRGRHGADTLREQGAQLLRASAEIGVEDEVHPAYVRILADLAPDEARILRLLTAEGPQPAVDVRSVNLIGAGAQLVAAGLNMVGTQAGCRHPERVPAYLNNLERLGLTCFSERMLRDHTSYQVIEAQPSTREAMQRAGRPKTVHRSLELTPLGVDFCTLVLPPTTADLPVVSPRL